MGKLLDAIRAKNQAAGVGDTPAEVKEQPSGRARSALAGFLDSLTMGAAPHIAAGQRQFDNPLLATTVGTGVGAVDAIANLFGADKFDATEPQNIMDEALTAHPGYSLAGEVAGSILPGAGMARGGIRAAEAASRRAPGAIRSAADFLSNTLAGRTATAVGAGAGQGALTAANKDETGGNIALDALAGGTLGGFGQLALGEAVPALARKIIGSGGRSRTNARAVLGSEIQQSMMGAPDPTTGLPSATGFIPEQAMNAEAQRLGPTSTLADVNPGARDIAMGAMADPTINRQMYPVGSLMDERLGVNVPGRAPTVSAYENFEHEMRDLLPGNFHFPAGAVPEARAADTIRAHAREYQQSLRPEYEAVHNTVRNINFRPQPIVDGIRRAFDYDNLTTEAHDTYEHVLDRLNFQLGQGANQGRLNSRQLASFRTELDDMLNTEYGAQTPKYRIIGMLTEARNTITNQLNQVPGFREVNARFASAASYQRASELGRELLKPSGMSAERMANYMQSANPGDTAGFLEGLTYTLSDLMERSGGEGAVARRLSRDDVVGRKLAEAFGQGPADQMIESANRALALTGTASELRRGSQTASRLRAKQSVSPNKQSIDPWIVTGAIWNMIKPGQGASKAAGLGAAGRLIPKPNDPAYNTELARLLSLQGPQAIAGGVNQIQQATDLFRLPVSLGGLDRTLDAQASGVPQSLISQAMTTDLGQSPAFILGNAVNSLMNVNTPDTVKDRARRRMQ